MQNLFSQTFAKDRTESDILAHEPIRLRLGKDSLKKEAIPVEYLAPPLTLRKGKEWRDRVSKVLNELATGALSGTVTAQSFMEGIMVAFFRFPDQVLELLIAYYPELDKHRELLMDTATDEEVVVAFSRVMVVAYPYFSLLGSMKTAAVAASQATSHQ